VLDTQLIFVNVGVLTLCRSSSVQQPAVRWLGFVWLGWRNYYKFTQHKRVHEILYFSVCSYSHTI